jgi:NTP pyrophosphatase (non-canonical NTP hydrolase)
VTNTRSDSGEPETVGLGPDLLELVAGIEADVADLTDRQGWEHNHLTRMTYLMSEVGELARELVALPAAADDVSPSPTDDDRQRIGSEIYDVIWNAIDLGRLLGIDLTAAFKSKREHNQRRVWSSNHDRPATSMTKSDRTDIPTT